MKASLLVAALFALAPVASLHGQVAYSGTPHNVVSVPQVSEGLHRYTFDFTWSQDTVLGDWANDAWTYTSVSQNTAQPNALNLRTNPAGTIVYRVVIPVDVSLIDEVTVAGRVRRGVVGRVRPTTSDSYFTTENTLFIGTDNYPPEPTAVVLNSGTQLDASVPGEVSFFIQLQNESGSNLGAVGFLEVSATTIPEPSVLGLGLAGAAMVFARRRRPATC